MRRILSVVLIGLALIPGFGCKDSPLKGSVRLVVASPDFPPLELVLNDEAVHRLDGPGASAYGRVDAKSFALAIREAGTTVPFYGLPVVVDRNAEYTAFVAGDLAAPSVSWVKDDNEPAGGDLFKYRVYNGVKGDDKFDVYVIQRDDKFEDALPSVLGIPYANRTAYLTRDPNRLRIIATLAGDDTPLAEIEFDATEDLVRTFLLVENSSGEIEILALRDSG